MKSVTFGSKCVKTFGLVIFFVGFCCTNKQVAVADASTTEGERGQPLIIGLKHIKNDSVPFCAFAETSSLSHVDFPAEEKLKFSAEELREIATSDYLMHLNTQASFISKKNDKIYFLLGRDFSGNPVISFDANNDGKFANEKVYNLNTQLPFIPIENLKYYITDTPQLRTIYIRPQKRNNESSVSLTRMPTYLYDTVDLNGSLYKVALISFSNELFFPKKYCALEILPINSLFRNCMEDQIQFKVGDTIYLPNQIYVWDSVSLDGRRLFLLPLKQNTNYGIDEGFTVVPFSGEDVITGKTFKLGNGKYTLLDFWGTWCGPCIQSIPDLIDIHKKYRNKGLEIVSIASDDSIDAVKDFLKRKDIGWVNLFEAKSEGKVTGLFAINTFPTYILIDPSGKILSRKWGVNGLKEIRAELSDRLK